MTRKQSAMFEEMHGDLRYIRHEMRVNGSVGLESILKSHDIAIKSQGVDLTHLKARSDTLWNVTDKLRTKTELFQAWKRYSGRSPVCKFVLKLFTHKFVLIGLFAFLFFVSLITLGYSVTEAVKAALQFIGVIK